MYGRATLSLKEFRFCQKLEQADKRESVIFKRTGIPKRGRIGFRKKGENNLGLGAVGRRGEGGARKKKEAPHPSSLRLRA